MKKNINLSKALLAMSWRLLLQHRSNFFGTIFVSSGWAFMSIITTYLLTRQVRSVFGYTPNELLAINAIHIIFFGVFHAFISRNMERISEYINHGLLDSILLKPVDSQFLLSFTHHNYPALARVVMGVIILWYLMSGQNGEPLGFGGFVGVLGFLTLFVCGIILLYSIWFILVTLLIWFPQMDNIVELMYHLNNASKFPMSFYKEYGLFVLIVFTPFALILSVPFRILTGRHDLTEIFLHVGVTAIFFVASRLFWRFALRHYTSASA
jgi:ABC-2 type transport system permease protein